jgi:hypothetical protein
MAYMFQQKAKRTSIGQSILYSCCPGTFPEEIKGKKSTRIANVMKHKPPGSQQ